MKYKFSVKAKSTLMNSQKNKTMICVSCQSEIPIPTDIPTTPGDVNVCYKCGKLYIFSGSMELVEMTKEMEHVFNMKYPRHAQAIAEIRARIRANARMN